MNEIKAMTKRNLLIYFRDKSAVFFSILSALILLAIMELAQQRKMQKMPRGWFNCGSWVVFWVLTA